MDPEQELFELVLVRDLKYDRWQGAFFGKPESVREVVPNDLFAPRPTKPWLWTSAGRKDDMFTYGNGWNFHPTAFQEIVETHHTVKAAVMVGSQGMNSVLLVELIDPDTAVKDREKVLNELYPTIERAWRESGNKPITRVARSNVIFAPPEMPFVRTAKRSLSKWKTVDAFKDEIAELDEASN